MGRDPFDFDDDQTSNTPLQKLPKAAYSKKKSVQIGPFARFPNKLFSSGMASKIGKSACLLYMALCESANREPSNKFRASDKALASETGLSPRTIRNARTTLFENGLVTFSREPGESYTYTLLPQDLKWVPLKERPRLKNKPRGNAVTLGRQQS